MGDKLNGRKDRFDKSDIIEKAMEEYSDGSIEYVDEIGYDHICSGVAKLEAKSQKNCLYTPKGTKKTKTSSIKLMNSLGDASARKRKDVIKFDALAIIDSDPSATGVAYIMANDIKNEWLEFGADGVSIQIPTDFLVFICEKTEPLCLKEGKGFFDYKRRKDEFQRDYIRSFK
tara:strand:- start:1381 stop:1899 length:519 start_codon:yes stop_codon:yes gene_type:complete